MNRRLGSLRLALFLHCAMSFAPPLAFAVNISTVLVDNAGNGGDSSAGAVPYDYHIGKYEVTNGQYAEFLNGVAATDAYALYNASMAASAHGGITQSGSSGSFTYAAKPGMQDKPVNFVSWGDAARFSNWLHNGQPAGAQDATTTEDGAYTLNGATTNAELNAVVRNGGAIWFLPTQDEWHKAALHKNDGVTGNYWDYPTASDTVPYSDQPPGSDAPTQSNTANFFKDDSTPNGYDDGYAVTGSPTFPAGNPLTDVGAYTFSESPYGTFDQAGNVSEWTEALFLSGAVRGLRGGSWAQNSGFIEVFSGASPSLESNLEGFRVAAVPEPTAVLLAAIGAIGLLAWGGRLLGRGRSTR